MQCRGIRGAIVVSANGKNAILTSTKKLLTKMIRVNQIETEDIAAIIFTTTKDLNAEFPAAAARELGWPSDLALLCGHEMDVPGALPHCLRVLMLVNTQKKPDEMVHVYLGEAKRLKDKASPAIGGDT